MSVSISRRRALQGAIAFSAAGHYLWRPVTVLAQAALTLGDAQLTVLSDGALMLPMDFAFPDAPQQELEALLKANGLPTDALRPDCNVTFVDMGERKVLIDAGSGPNFMPTAGKLMAALEDAAIDAETVTDVILTHAHPDHLWGIVDEFDEVPFANATVRVAQAEWDFWRAEDTLANMPDARKTFVVGAQARFAAIEDQVEFFKPGDEVAPGIEAIDTRGHTPGHVSFAVHGGSESLIVLGDAITNHIVSFQKPDWPSGSDQDAALGAQTRKAMLDRLAADKARIIGFHLPYPGSGRVERASTAYRFVAG